MEKKRQRKFSVRAIFRARKLKGEFHTLIQDFKFFDLEYFLKQLRMTPTTFEELLRWVVPKIEKLCVWRRTIGLEQGFCVTFRYLVTRDAYVAIAVSYRISPASICRIIKETTGAIWDVLLENGYLQPPRTSKT